MPEVAPIWVGLLGRKSLKFAPPPSSSGESRFNQFRALTGSSIHHCPQRRDRLIPLLVAEPLTPAEYWTLNSFGTSSAQIFKRSVRIEQKTQKIAP
jgi:hypothetical protein